MGDVDRKNILIGGVLVVEGLADIRSYGYSRVSTFTIAQGHKKSTRNQQVMVTSNPERGKPSCHMHDHDNPITRTNSCIHPSYNLWIRLSDHLR